MRTINFQIGMLGMNGVGKSSFLSALAAISQLSNQISIVPNQNNRYYVNTPTPADNFDVLNYTLNYQNNSIVQLYFFDYSGANLRHNAEQSAIASRIQSSLNDSDYLFVLIDGTLFVDKEPDEIRNTIRRKYSRHIQPYITNCSAAHGDICPPVILIVTHFEDLKQHNYPVNLIRNILTDAFSSVFTEEIRQYIICVDNISGVGVPLPILTALNHALLQSEARNQSDLEEQKQKIDDSITDRREFLKQQDSRFLLKSRSKMAQARQDIYQMQNNKIALQEQFNANSNSYGIMAVQRTLSTLLHQQTGLLIYGFSTELGYPYDMPNTPATKPSGKELIIVTVIFCILAAISGWLCIGFSAAYLVYALGIRKYWKGRSALAFAVLMLIGAIAAPKILIPVRKDIFGSSESSSNHSDKALSINQNVFYQFDISLLGEDKKTVDRAVARTIGQSFNSQTSYDDHYYSFELGDTTIHLCYNSDETELLFTYASCYYDETPLEQFAKLKEKAERAFGAVPISQSDIEIKFKVDESCFYTITLWKEHEIIQTYGYK